MDKIDLALEVIEMDKFYEQNEDFRRYVDAALAIYRKPLAETFENPIVREYYRSLQKGGCNEARREVKNQ